MAPEVTVANGEDTVKWLYRNDQEKRGIRNASLEAIKQNIIIETEIVKGQTEVHPSAWDPLSREFLSQPGGYRCRYTIHPQIVLGSRKIKATSQVW